MRPCLDCGQPAQGTRCPEHERQYRAKRGPWQAGRPGRRVYDTPEWRRARATHLEKHPYCVVCGKEHKKGQRMHVHHIVGVANDLDHTKLSTVCPSCHSIIEELTRRGRNYMTVDLEVIRSLVERKIGG